MKQTNKQTKTTAKTNVSEDVFERDRRGKSTYAQPTIDLSSNTEMDKKNGNAAVRDFMFSRTDICEMITWDVCHCAVHIDGDDCNAIQFKYVFTVRPNIRPHMHTHRYVQEAQFIRQSVGALNPVNNKGLHQG